jgi:peptidoglycan/xylan/chitin deacetylase (PgdA/CDA1 family)
VQWFCYPIGRFDDQTVALVRRAGYVLAVTTQAGTLQRASDPLRLSRVRVSNTTGVAGLANALGA